MVDFATLRMGVDTAALVKGERALDTLATAGAQAETKIDTAMQGVGRSAEVAADRIGTAAARMDGATRAATQNLTFQLQDIGMMLAAGQNPFILAMQQGSQVAGALEGLRGGAGILRGIGGAFAGLLSPVSLATFAVIGFGSAAIQWLTDTSGEVKTLDDALGDLNRSLSDVREVASLLTQTDLTDLKDQFGQVSAEVLRLLELQREFALMDAMRGIRDVVTAATEGLDGYLTSSLDGIAAQFQTTYDNARRIQSLMEEVQRASTPEEALVAVIALRSHIDSTTGSVGSLGDAAYEMARGLVQSESTLRQVVVQAERSKQALSSARSEAEGLSGAAPGPGWMAPAIAETNGLINRLIAAHNVAASLSAQAQFDRENKVYSGRGADPRMFMPGGAKPFVPTKEVEDLADAMVNLDVAASGSGASNSGASGAMKEAAKAAEALQREMNRPLVSAIDGVSNAFGTFIANGLSDFKGFTKSIINSFKGMIAQMIATAARNRIMIGLGIGGGVGGIGGAASAATSLMGGGGGLLGLGGAASGLWSGLSGVLSGGGLGSSFANLGGLLSGSVGGLGAIGAAIPALGAIGLVAGLFSKKTKLLDEGLTLNANEWGGLANSFNTKQTSRFFGLSKKTRTTIGPNVPEVSGAIGAMQAEIASMAKSLGVGAEAFKGFGYTVNLSLKGLTEDQRAAKVAEEIAKMGDAFAAMIPGVKSVNDLLAITQQRYDLETQLLTLQGNEAELRRRTLETINPHNRALQRQIWAMEDAQEATNKLNEALGQLSENDYATALDFNRARGALASGLRVVGGTDTVAPIVASVGTGSTASPMDARMEAILANINSNIALLWKQVQRWDIDGLPAERTA